MATESMALSLNGFLARCRTTVTSRCPMDLPFDQMIHLANGLMVAKFPLMTGSATKPNLTELTSLILSLRSFQSIWMERGISALMERNRKRTVLL